MWQDQPVWMTAICIASMRYACPREGVSLGQRACAFAIAGEVCASALLVTGERQDPTAFTVV